MTMTCFRLCNRDVLLLLTLMASWSVATTAWVTSPILPNNACSMISRRSTGTTRLYMFDWFNPKPKTTTKEETKSDDWLSKMFNQVSPSPSPETADQIREEALEKTRPKEEVKSEPIVSAVTAEAPAKEDVKPAAAKEERHSGVVNWFNRLKGYGFISASDGSSEADVFVHQTEIQAEGYRYLLDGEEVEYKMEHDKNGRPRAIHVTGPKGGDLKISVSRKEKDAAKNDEAKNN